MNKLILILALVLVGCATERPMRTALSCDQEYISSTIPIIWGSQKRGPMVCNYVQVPVAPTAKPLEVSAELVK